MSRIFEVVDDVLLESKNSISRSCKTDNYSNKHFCFDVWITTMLLFPYPHHENVPLLCHFCRSGLTPAVEVFAALTSTSWFMTSAALTALNTSRLCANRS